jgi:hypothetical protein
VVGGTAGQVLAKIDSTDYNTQWVNQSGGGGGVAEILGTSPITASPSSGTVTVSVGTATTSAAGVVQLSDSTSTTSSDLAATPTAVKDALANIGKTLVSNTTGGVVSTFPPWFISSSHSPANGEIAHFRIIPHQTIVVANIAMTTSAIAAATVTLIRMGIYTRSGTTFTLVARTASDVTLFNATNTKFTRALDTTGGYPATYTMNAGSEYWISVIQVATTPATLAAAVAAAAQGTTAAGQQQYRQTSQSDLVASSTGSTVTTRTYAEVSS